MHQQIKAALKVLRPGWAADDVAIGEYLEGGYSNHNYRLRYQVQEFVLRIMAPGSAAAFKRELAALEGLAARFPHDSGGLRLEIPAVTAAASGISAADDAALLTLWSDLPLLAETAAVTPVALATYLAALHHRLAELPDPQPRSKTATLRQQIAADLQLGASGSRSKPGLVAKLLTQLPADSNAQALCHLDLNPWNLLTDRTTWLTLDWETLQHADPLFDLVALCDGYLRAQNRSSEQRGFAAEVLAIYNQHTAGSRGSAALDDARALFRWREYAWAAGQLALGNHRIEIVEQFDDYAALLLEQGFHVLPGAPLAGSALPPDDTKQGLV